MTAPDPICAWCHPPERWDPADLADTGTVFLCDRHQEQYDEITARLPEIVVPTHPADQRLPRSFMEGLTGRTPEPPSDPLAELNKAIGWLNDTETAYRDRLLALANSGGTPEAICTVAIDDRIRRFPRLPGQVPSWGATAVDFGRAAVEALRITGHLPPEGEQRSLVEKLEQVTRELDAQRELNSVLAQGVREPHTREGSARGHLGAFVVRYWIPIGAVTALIVLVAFVMLGGG